jgi:pimeloyl-ACP methyl ester carboxylesterase
MARHLASRGLTIVTVDPPGVGESDVPDDPFDLTPELVADLVDAAVDAVTTRLAASDRPGTSATRRPPVIGLGHSAGGLLTVVQQRRHERYDALALLGFAGTGLPEILTDEERRCVGQPEALRRVLPALVRRRFGGALPWLGSDTTDFITSGATANGVKAALAGASGPLLGLVGMASLIPGSIAAEQHAVSVPVFIGAGDQDIVPAPVVVASEYSSCGDMTLFELRGSGHNHNVAPDRELLWDRIAAWSLSLASPLGSQ